MTFYDRHICHFMTFLLFYDINDGHKIPSKYGIMGINLTVLISRFQLYDGFSMIMDVEGQKLSL